MKMICTLEGQAQGTSVKVISLKVIFSLCPGSGHLREGNLLPGGTDWLLQQGGWEIRRQQVPPA